MSDEQNKRKVTKAERPMRDLLLLMPHLPIGARVRLIMKPLTPTCLWILPAMLKPPCALCTWGRQPSGSYWCMCLLKSALENFRPIP